MKNNKQSFVLGGLTFIAVTTTGCLIKKYIQVKRQEATEAIEAEEVKIEEDK